ncbi:uncharacterized protein [Apostichopus japonicus]|uniref:uncharacterized protein n=1 Tax=Stichopus japonicus TaxID=307972 RepID=UPI003AB7AD99
MGTCVVTVLMVLVMFTKSELIANDEECDHLQYLTNGRNGTIQCSFSEYYAVSWFNIEKDTTILFYEKGVIPEDGYASDDYDLYPNGSLFIRNVTLEHETLFLVTKVISLTEPTVSYEIRVRIIVPPSVPHPVIEQCQDNLTVCYAIQDDSSALSCFVQNVRPRISLGWNQREADRDKPLTSELTIDSRNNETFTSRSTVQISAKFPSLSVFVCSAEENAWLLEESETVVVLEKEGPGRISETRKQYIELHTTMLLPCTSSDVPVIVWKRMVDTETTEEVLLLRVKTWTSDFNETYNNDFRLNSDGSLLLRNTEWHHQGRYTCLVAEYTPEELHIDVVIFVMPVPRYLKVAGCDFQQYCVLKVNQGDVLTCSVHGIRPEVNLEWRVHEPNTKVSFLQENHRVQPSGDNYDVTLTSTITFTPATENRVTVECRVVGTNADIFNLSQTIDLLIPNVQANSNDTGVLTAVITVAIVVFMVVILMIGGIILRKVIHSNDSQEGGNLEEAIPMMSTTETNKLDQLITELKGKYKLLYDAVQPIPYIRDRMVCVDRVFVEGGIEYLEKTSGTTSNDIWKPLASYRELFNKIGDESKRQILEGDPGYGKSTLTLQLAYDWCNNISNSPISKVKVLVFLRLRQLGGVQSIYDAIRKFILAKDSKFTEDDVKSLFNESGSVLLILDGYDEYPDQDNMDTDVSLIIKKEIMRDIDVILTTRSSYLPKHRAPQTSRVRLRGFDETARDQYIRKAVVGDDNEDEIEKIKLKLKQNPVLGDLCDVPLFFVMFAHITHESENFETFHSVTGFFRYMISCFHSHLRNKMRDENVKMSEAHENDHSLLDKVAFEALSGYSKKIVWKKEQLRNLFGEEFYNQYIRVGILVEDDVLDCDDGRVAEFHAQYIVEVRFYHKLFCEWYAAHYLARNVSKLSSNADQLLGNLDPFDLQYVYRFACGLNKDTSEHIIKYLQRTDERKKFAILCIQEGDDNMQNYVESVTKLVSNNVDIHEKDSRLLQRLTLHILEFASKKEIPISCLYLYESFSKIDAGDVILHSGLRLPCPVSVKQIVIFPEEGREMTETEVVDILMFVQQSYMLEELTFWWCQLPQSIPAESIPSILKSRNVKVSWGECRCYLNLQSGRWMKKQTRQDTTDTKYNFKHKTPRQETTDTKYNFKHNTPRQETTDTKYNFKHNQTKQKTTDTKYYVKHNTPRQDIAETKSNFKDIYTIQEISDTEYNDAVTSFRKDLKDTEWQKARISP